MIPYFSIEDFSIGPLTLYTWGFFIALAFLVGLVLAVRQAKKIGASRNEIIWLVIFIYIGAMVGGRLFFILQTPLEFLRSPAEIFNTSDGGMMFYGGLVGAAAAGLWYLRKIEKRWQLINALIPIVPFVMAIGRIGCFLNNEHLGAITRVPWAILWPDDFLRHPVALYLILFDLALAGALWWWSRRNNAKLSPSPQMRGGLGWGVDSKKNTTSPQPPPQLRRGGIPTFVLFFLIYSLGRFFLDFTRDPLADPHIFGLASSQWISLVIIFTAAFICYRVIKNAKIKV